MRLSSGRMSKHRDSMPLAIWKGPHVCKNPVASLSHENGMQKHRGHQTAGLNRESQEFRSPQVISLKGKSGKHGKQWYKPADERKCWRYGGRHGPHSCSFKSSQCYKCQQAGHTKSQCEAMEKFPKIWEKHYLGGGTSEEEGRGELSHLELADVGQVNRLIKTPPFEVRLLLNTKSVSMELDTGSPGWFYHWNPYRKSVSWMWSRRHQLDWRHTADPKSRSEVKPRWQSNVRLDILVISWLVTGALRHQPLEPWSDAGHPPVASLELPENY